MVEQISYEELKRLWGHTDERGIAVSLSPDEIEDWKKNGKFKHLKRELENIPNIKFACTQEDDGLCWYTFFTHSKELSNRIVNLCNELKYSNSHKKYIHITEVDNKNGSCCGRVTGSERSCSLF